MQQLTLPGTDLQVSALCLGTAEYGADISEDDSFALLDAFVEGGGRFIDTAAIYADWTPAGKGSSERTIGKWLASRSPQNVVVATKGAHPELHSMAVGRMSPVQVEGDLDSSLRNLGIESIDLYYLHRDDPSIPVEEILAMLEEFVRAGKIRYYACSNWRAPRIEESQGVAEQMGAKGFVANQPFWNFAVPDLTGGDPTWAKMDDAVLAWHERTGVASIPYSSQANGYFQKIAEGRPLSGGLEAMYDSDLVRAENRARVARLEALSAQTGLSLTQLVLGWLRGHSFPVVPIVGPRTMEQLHDCLSAGDVRLSSEQVAELSG